MIGTSSVSIKDRFGNGKCVCPQECSQLERKKECSQLERNLSFETAFNNERGLVG